MLEYCWLAYSKASSASGPQLIGRTFDLWVAQNLQRAGISLEDHQTLWDPHTKGNIQVLDKWAPVVDDCWMLGGVHRRADFELVSIPSTVKLVCTDAAKARAATIQAYDRFMKGKERLGPDSIRSILVMDPSLASEIQTFDRARLRHVAPPK